MPSRPEGRTTAIKYGLDLLSRRDHFTPEIERRLHDAGCSAETVGEAIRELHRQGLLDDQRLADHRVQRWRRQGRSEAECRSRLQARGVDSTIIQKALGWRGEPGNSEMDSEIDPEIHAAIEALRRSMPAAGGIPSPEKLASRLGRRGFEADTIRAALRHYGLDDFTSESSDDSSVT